MHLLKDTLLNSVELSKEAPMNFTLESELEEDGRGLAEVRELPSVLAYGSTKSEAMARAEILASRVVAEKLKKSETAPHEIQISIPV